MRRSSYGEPDFAFGQLMLTLRMTIGLTQTELANSVGISRHGIGDWESGQSYPKVNHLKKFISLCVQHKAFTAGRELEDIRALWLAAHQRVLLDESWLEGLLSQTQSTPSPQSPAFITTRPTTPGADSINSITIENAQRLDWGDAIDVPTFYGREEELAQLSSWLIEDRCRIVTVLGLGGMGKSALTVTLMHKIAADFEVVIWRSLRDAPDCETLIDSCLQTLDPEGSYGKNFSLDQRFTHLLKHLQSRRVLLVLDNFESLLDEGQNMGYMRTGYEDYGRFLLRFAETSHQSCLLLTSREKPVELVPFEGTRALVRVLRLKRLAEAACDQLLLDKDIAGTFAQRAQLSEIFTGNPLALKIVAQTIADLFEGNVGLFLKQGETIFGGVKKLLDQQFARLSEREQTVFLWLAILREQTTIEKLLTSLVSSLPRVQLLETLDALHRRSLIERGENPGTFTLQSVVLEYLTARLVEEVATELTGEAVNINLLLQHSLIQAQARDYIRQGQQRVFVQPLLARLKSAGSPGNAEGAEAGDRAEQHLRLTLEKVKKLPSSKQGYAGGNILNLLLASGSDLEDWDFSGITVWQAYLAGVDLRNVNLTGSDLRGSVFREGFSSVLSLDYHPTGQFLAGGSLNGSIKVWQMNPLLQGGGYSLRMEYQGHENVVNSVVYSPDGRFVASGGIDRTVRLWDAVSGKNLLTLHGHGEIVRSVVFSPDGSLLASGSFDGTIKLWRIGTGHLLATFQGHSDWIWSVAFSPDGQHLLTGCNDGTVCLWDLRNIKDENGLKVPATGLNPSRTLNAHHGGVQQVIFSPDGQTFYTCGSDGKVRRWSVLSLELLQTFEGHIGPVQAIALSSDGTVLASSGMDRVVRIWQPGRDKPLLTLSGHTASIMALAFNRSGNILASSSADRSVRLWSIPGGQSLVTLQGYTNSLRSLAVNLTGSYVAGAGSSERVLIWPLTNQNISSPDSDSQTQAIMPSVVLKGHTHQLIAVAFSSDGTRLASAGMDNLIKVWDLTGLSSKETSQPTQTTQPTLTITGPTESVSTIAFSPKSNLIASGGVDGELGLWSTINGEKIVNLIGHTGTIWSVCFSPDGTTLASGGNDSTLRVWDSENYQLKFSFNFNKVFILGVAYHPTGKLIACALNDGKIALCSTADNNEPPRILTGHQSTVWSVAFSPDTNASANLASGGNDGTVRLWNTESGREVTRFEHGECIRSVTFTPDGTGILSAGEDGLVKLWDIASSQLVKTFRDYQPYEGVNITGATSLTTAQRTTLLTLGAVES